MDDPRVDLFFLRHADAGDPEAWHGPDDERPLSASGQRQSERLGRHLAAIGLKVDAFLTSPRTRAAETAAIVGDLVGMRPRVDERLGGGLDLTTAEAILDDHGRIGSAFLVGHDPDFSALVSELCGVDTLTLRKCALARLDARRPLSRGGAVLRWLIPPDALGKT